MGVHQELDELLANPECHAILVNALGEYRSLLHRNADDFADEFELAHIGRSVAHIMRSRTCSSGGRDSRPVYVRVRLDLAPM